MKILSAGQVAKADAFTIENEPIKSIDLMERAAKACYDWICEHYEKSTSFKVFAGVGNNGGDGMVIARLLREKGYDAEVIFVSLSDNCSADCSTNLQRFKKLYPDSLTILTKNQADFEVSGAESIIVDAIFGSGINRPVTGFTAEVIAKINNSGAEIIAIDMPSGLFTDDNSENNMETIVKADTTLSLELPKLAFMFSENEQFVGQWHIIPIGLNNEFVEKQESQHHFTGKGEVRQLIKSRPGFGHKGTFGHALLCGGSFGMIGAAVLMSRSCLRSGAGLVTAVVPRCGHTVLQTTVPEVLCKSLEEQEILSGSLDVTGYQAVGIGPGIGTHKRTAIWLKDILNTVKVPLLLDADAINIIAESNDLVGLLPKDSVLTPHPGEFDRLVNKSNSAYERVKLQVRFAVDHGVYVVLKGRHTSICTPDGEVYFNGSGNAGMATGGSGDVLTGLITGLLAQGYPPLYACQIGVYIHGLAGDIQVAKISEQALTASDIVNGLGEAFLEIVA